MVKNLDFMTIGFAGVPLTAQGANIDGQFCVNLYTEDPDGAFLDKDDITDLIAWLQNAKEWLSDG
jgi:hypothetical protein